MIKKVDKRDKQLPQSFEELIEMYNLENLWKTISELQEKINELNSQE